MEQTIISHRDTDVTVRFSEPTQEDIQPFIKYGFNIDFSKRVKVTATDCTGTSGVVFMERETVKRLGVQYVADHAVIVPMLGDFKVEVSQSDWHNNPHRNPERVIPVRFVKTENGTGREIYRGLLDDLYYAREVYFPRENCAKWFCYGCSANAGDGSLPRPNTVFVCDGQREKVTYDDWNDVMAYSGTFNENFNK